MSSELPSRIPIFPLPDTVFFPGTVLPLHVFEARYQCDDEQPFRRPGLDYGLAPALVSVLDRRIREIPIDMVNARFSRKRPSRSTEIV